VRAACEHGLDSVTIGSLADDMGLSKSGIFTQFGSIGALHAALAEAYARRFEHEVIAASRSQAPGLPRLRALCHFWATHVSADGGRRALYIMPAGRHCSIGAVDELAAALLSWRAELELCVRQAVEKGQLASGTDAAQLAHDLYGTLLLVQHDVRIFH